MINILVGNPEWIDWTNNFKLLPYSVFFNELDNIDKVILCIKENNINTIIPCTYKQMFFIIENTSILSQYVKCILCNSSKKSIKLLNNKMNFCNYMMENGFGEYIPKVFINHSDGKRNVQSDITYPCIFKLNKTCSGYKSVVILSVNNLYSILNNKQNKNYIIQEYIVSPNEYSGHFYIMNGLIKYFVLYMATDNNKNYIQKGKMSNYVKVIDNRIDFCMDIFSKIFTKLNYTGFACADFKLYDDNLKIFEINPRLGGTIINDRLDFVELMNACVNS